MEQLIKKTNYFWILLALFFSNNVLGEKILDLEEKETDSQAEFLATETHVINEIADEREVELSSLRNGETQNLLFMRSENISDHLLSSGGTPFTQFESFMSVNFLLNNEQKLKDASEKQKKELLDRLIEKYLQRFPSHNEALKK
ncbi:MAG: hypothetical protein BGO77_06445 [Caedibacter sp. 37-49]|nr:MAG: hypothetical protein BGO77_06445 [Caedibacter sp. 37-49]